MPASAFKFRAFISYRHKEKVWGDWLHKALEAYRVPRELVGQAGRDGPIPGRIAPVFRDREDLAASVDLGSEIRAALAASANLIVICSPGAVASQFVADEIVEFKRLGRSDRIFAIIVEGEPNARDPALECFPDALKYHLKDDGTLSAERAEPIAADARDQGDGKENAKLKLIAGILGVGFDQLRRREQEAQRRRFRRFAAVAAGLVTVFAGLAAAAGWFGYVSQIERARAEDNLDKARRTANGVVVDLAGQFRDAAGMQAALGRRILDRAKALMDELGSQGEMTEARLRDRATALGLLGRVTLDLGQTAPAATALGEAVRIWNNLLVFYPGDPVALTEAAKAETALSWAASARGDLEEEERLKADARARIAPLLAGPATGIDESLLAEALDLAITLDPDPEGAPRRANLTRLIAIRERLAAGDASGEQTRKLAADYRIAAQIASATRDFVTAKMFDDKSIAILEKLAASDTYVARWQGDLAAQYMGSAVEAYRRGELPAAKARLDQSLVVSERLIGIDPTNIRYRELAANALDLVNALANQEGDLAGQEASQLRGVENWRGLVRVDPRNVEARASLVAVLQSLANFYNAVKRVDDQIAVLREAAVISAENVRRAGNPETIAQQAGVLVNMAYALQSKDVTSEEALQLLETAQALLKPLVAAKPGDTSLRDLETEIETLRTLIAAQRRAAPKGRP